jgi:predicted DNA-binding WGR domain protein
VGSLEEGIWQEVEGDLHPADEKAWEKYRRKHNRDYPLNHEAGGAAGAATAPPATAGAKRYFELVAGTSRKFWAISLSGSDVTTRWGRIGTDGQSKAKTFKDAATAKREHDKLIAEKTSKGYTEK